MVLADLGVVGLGDEGEHAVDARARLFDAAGGGLREREHPERGVLEQAIIETAADGRGFGGEGRDAFESQVVELESRQRHAQLEADL